MAIILDLHIFILILCCMSWANVKGTQVTPSPYYIVTQHLRASEAVTAKVPPGGGTAPVDVSITLIPYDVSDVDDAKQVLVMRCNLFLSWTDASLGWQNHSQESVRSLESVNLSPDEIWRPTVFITNGASDNVLLDIPGYLEVHANGSVGYMVSFLAYFSCAFELRKYPFDVQQCYLKVLLNSAPKIRSQVFEHPVYNRRNLYEDFQGNNEWEFQQFSMQNYYSRAISANISVFQFQLKRKTAFYVMSFIVPIVVTSYINTFVFLVPGDSGERVSFLVSIFLSNAVFVGFCTNQMPEGMDTIPLVMYLLQGIMVESAVLIVIVSLLARYSLRQTTHDVTPINVIPDEAKQARDAFRQDRLVTKFAVSKVVNPSNNSRPSATETRFRPVQRVETVCFLCAVTFNTAFILAILMAMV